MIIDPGALEQDWSDLLNCQVRSYLPIGAIAPVSGRKARPFKQTPTSTNVADWG